MGLLGRKPNYSGEVWASQLFCTRDDLRTLNGTLMVLDTQTLPSSYLGRSVTVTQDGSSSIVAASLKHWSHLKEGAGLHEAARLPLRMRKQGRQGALGSDSCLLICG